VVGVFFFVTVNLQLCEHGFDEPPRLGDLAAFEMAARLAQEPDRLTEIELGGLRDHPYRSRSLIDWR